MNQKTQKSMIKLNILAKFIIFQPTSMDFKIMPEFKHPEEIETFYYIEFAMEFYIIDIAKYSFKLKEKTQNSCKEQPKNGLKFRANRTYSRSYYFFI